MEFAPYEDYFIRVDDIVVSTARSKTKLVSRLSTGNKITTSVWLFKEKKRKTRWYRYIVQYVSSNPLPSLGNYSLNQPRSVVIMDNCATRPDLHVKELIEILKEPGLF